MHVGRKMFSLNVKFNFNEVYWLAQISSALHIFAYISEIGSWIKVQIMSRLLISCLMLGILGLGSITQSWRVFQNFVNQTEWHGFFWRQKSVSLHVCLWKTRPHHLLGDNNQISTPAIEQRRSRSVEPRFRVVRSKICVHSPITSKDCFVCLQYRLLICFFIFRISSACIWISVAWPW